MVFILVLWQVSNIIFVDSPSGTGFSYSKNPPEVGDVKQANDLFEFLQKVDAKDTPVVLDYLFLSNAKSLQIYVKFSRVNSKVMIIEAHLMKNIYIKRVNMMFSHFF